MILVASEKYKKIGELYWNESEKISGKIIKVKGFPRDKKVKLFWATVSTNRTEYIVTNDLNQSSVDAVEFETQTRWKIEEFHREIKQLTGIEFCQCRLSKIQRNHIACAMLVWNFLCILAVKIGKTKYPSQTGITLRLLKPRVKEAYNQIQGNFYFIDSFDLSFNYGIYFF